MLPGSIPVRILRAAQFHEFVPQLLEWDRQGEVSNVPSMRTQPVAARTVAEALADLVNGSAPLDDPSGRRSLRGGRPATGPDATPPARRSRSGLTPRPHAHGERGIRLPSGAFLRAARCLNFARMGETGTDGVVGGRQLPGAPSPRTGSMSSCFIQGRRTPCCISVGRLPTAGAPPRIAPGNASALG
jgi:hypothetical protein